MENGMENMQVDIRIPKVIKIDCKILQLVNKGHWTV